MVSASDFLEFSLTAVHELDVHFVKPLPPKAPALEKNGKTISGKRKSLFQAPNTPRHQLWRKMQKRYIFGKPLPPQGTSSGGRRKKIFGKCKLLFQAPAPQGNSSGRRWKNDIRQAKITFQAPTSPRHQPYRERWNNDYRFSASENHFFKPLPRQGTSSKERWKNDYRQAKITCQHLPLPRHLELKIEKKNDLRQAASENHFSAPTPSKAPPLEEEETMIFGKQTSAFPGCGLSKHQFADTSSKQKSPFQILAPSNHQLRKNKHQTIFRIRNSHSKSIFIPDNRFFQSKSKQIRPYVGHKYVNLIVCFFLIVLPENKIWNQTWLWVKTLNPWWTFQHIVPTL